MGHALGTTLLLLAAASCAVCQNQPFFVTVIGTGKPMILIPGLESSGAVWDGAVSHYGARYRMHVLTLAGFAGRPSVPGLRLQDVRDGIVRYVRENQLDHPVLMGHSLGGFLALWVAATAPELVGPVVSVEGLPFLPALSDPSATAVGSKHAADQMRKLYASLNPQQMDAMSRMALTQMISQPKNVEVAAAWAIQSNSAFTGQAVYDLMTTDLREDLARIRTPLLLVGAGKTLGDATQEAYEKQVGNVRDHRVVVAPNALHFVMFDDPEFLWNAIDAFLAPGANHAR